MTHSYRYELVEGHIIVAASNQRLLVDTGAPSSVAYSSPLAFAGGHYPVQRNYMGVSPESLSNSVGTPIHALVGADVLNQYDILIDPTACDLKMSDEDLPLEGTTLGLDHFMGIPIIEVIVAQDRVRMFFDTGAKLSYLDPDRTRDFQSTGTERDFYPGFGDFTTNAYDVPITLGSETVVLRVGNLPELLQMTLMMADTAGILGTAILETHRVLLSPRRGIVTFERIAG